MISVVLYRLNVGEQGKPYHKSHKSGNYTIQFERLTRRREPTKNLTLRRYYR
jgi:hypothetical protein